MFGHVGKSVDQLFKVCAVLVPLGIWKLIDILYWIITNVSIGLK